MVTAIVSYTHTKCACVSILQFVNIHHQDRVQRRVTSQYLGVQETHQIGQMKGVGISGRQRAETVASNEILAIIVDYAIKTVLTKAKDCQISSPQSEKVNCQFNNTVGTF